MPGYVHHLAFSVPADHQVPWDEDSPSLASSVSSVEEATEHLTHHNVRRKTFNHLDVEEEHSQSSKSPRFLPRFLRASFSKLISKEKPSKGSEISSTPVSPVRSPSPHYSRHQQDFHCPEESRYSPTTGQFIQECLDKGLPIIPFNYR